MSRKLVPIPVRIKAKVGQVEDHPERPECNGKWCFEISMWDLKATHQVGHTLFFAPWETEEIANQEMNKAVKICCETIQKATGSPATGDYFDMIKGGVARNFNEQEH